MKQSLLQGTPVSLDDNHQLTLLLESDIEDIVTMLNDGQVTEFLWFAPSPDSFYRDYFMPMAERNAQAMSGDGEPFFTLVIRNKTTNAFAGMAALVPMGMIPGVYEVGYQLPVASWGKGLATKACCLLVDFAFDKLSAHKVTADCYASNKGSARVLEKAGMKREGRQKAFYPYNGGFDDRLHYGIESVSA